MIISPKDSAGHQPAMVILEPDDPKDHPFFGPYIGVVQTEPYCKPWLAEVLIVHMSKDQNNPR
jgi:hypothetical protein